MNKIRIPVLILMILFSAHSVYSQFWQSLSTANSGLPADTVNSILIDESGIKWFGTTNGIASYNGTDWRTYNTGNKLLSNFISDIVFENSNFGPEIWVSGDSGVQVISVSSMDAVTFATPYQVDNRDILSNTVYSSTIDTGHVKWFGTDQGVSLFTGSAWAQATANDLLESNEVLSLAAGPDGIVYNGTRDGGVARLAFNGIDVVTAASDITQPWSPILSNTFHAIYIDRDGVQWFGTEMGAYRHEGEDSKMKWRVFVESEGLVHNFVQAIAEDSSGNIWFGTKGGASCYSDEVFINYTTDDGLVSNNILDIAVDTDGSIWFGTDQGLSVLPPNPAGVKSKFIAKEFVIGELTNYPNPFNASTTIYYKLASMAEVRVTIYNVRGQIVDIIQSLFQQPGAYSIRWSGTMANGQPAPSGLYFYELKAFTKNSFVIESNKMLYLR